MDSPGENALSGRCLRQPCFKIATCRAIRLFPKLIGLGSPKKGQPKTESPLVLEKEKKKDGACRLGGGNRGETFLVQKRVKGKNPTKIQELLATQKNPWKKKTRRYEKGTNRVIGGSPVHKDITGNFAKTKDETTGGKKSVNAATLVHITFTG